MDLGMTGKVAIVTGGAKGIGEAIVRVLAGEGVSTVPVGRGAEAGEALAAELDGQGAPCSFVAGDLTADTVCRQAVEVALERFGRLDIVVNNAGVNDGVGLDAGPEAFVESLRRNLVHYYSLVHHAVDALRATQGVVINVGSKVAVTGQGGTSGYAAAKGGVDALTREWAVDLAADGVRVNAVIPAETWTPLYERCLASLPDPRGAREELERLIPLGRRFTTAREIADMVVFLASPRSSHTTGQIVYVDGGYTHLDRKCTALPGRLSAGEQ